MAVLNNPQGQVVNMQVTPNMQLQFGFDPGADAQLERVGDNLVFKFPDGGEIVLTGFYTLPVEELPKLDVQGAEITAQDFLASLGDDTLLPAAGPNAPAAPTAAPGGGFSPYADGAGNLIGGIDYLGKLGRIFWSSPVGNPITELGLEVPGGSGDISVDTKIGDAFAAGVFEDARPFQNVGDYTLNPAQLHFNATLTGTTTVANVELSGFDAGTKLYIGLPGQPGTVEIDIASPTQLVNFTHANFTLNGVYIVPPTNSDHDMNIHANITLTAVGGLSTVVPAEFTIIVDAVADMPVDVSGNTAVDGVQIGAEHPFESPTSAGEATGVTVHMNATFGDVKDGSEHHYFEVKGIPSDWTLTDIPAGWQLQAFIGGAWKNVSVAQWNALGHDANTTLRVDVTQAAIAEQKLGGGDDHATLSGDLHFNPHDWTSSGTGLDANGNPIAGEGLGRHNDGTINSDGPAKISIYAVAEEQAGDRELSLDNNTSRVDLGTTTVVIREDTPDFASEPIRIVSDETRHVQDGTDEMRIRDIPADVNAKLAEIADLPGTRPLSAAGSAIAYDLHSDGKADSGGDLGHTFLGFEGTNGADSGWATTGGKEIFMYYQDGMAIGRVGVLDPGTGNYVADPAGKIAFVAVATGTLQGGAAENGAVTFVQYESLRHPDHGSSANEGGYNEEMASDLGLKLVLIDDDGDKTSLDVNINVHDDQPVIENITTPHKVDETFLDLPHGVLVTGGHVDYSFGRDVDGAKVEWDAAQLPKLSCGGQDVQYDLSDPHQVRGFIVDADGKEQDVLTLTFSDKNGDGHGHYVYKQFIAVDHPDPTDHDEPLDFAFTLKVTDGDGDVVSQAITFRVEDDGPCAGLFVPANVVFEDTLRGDAHMMQANGKLSYDFGADHNAGADVFWDKSVLADTFKDVNATFGKSTSPVEVRYPDHGADNANPNQPHYAEIWTKDPATGADVKVADMLIFQDADGNYKYEYNQYHAIEHGAFGTPQDIVKEFNLGYTIMDSDGDTASNMVAMHVTDSVTLPRVDNFAHFDESDMKSDFSGVEGVIALKLDYDAPDGIKDVTWDLKGVNANLDIYNKIAPSEADGFYAKLDASGHVLSIYQHGTNGAGGVLVANVTLVENPDGTYSAVYDQVHQIDHPLGHQVGGIFHDDSLPFVLPMHVTDGDNDVTHSAVTIVVDDDGPSPLLASNVLLLEGIGKAVLDNMHDLDFSNANQFLDSLGKAISDAVLTGLGDSKSLIDFADLVANSNLMGLTDGSILAGKITDSDRTEVAGMKYSGNLAVDFGNDGPADPADHNSYYMNPVGFSAAGVEGLLNALGVHQTGHGNAHLEVVGSGGNPPTTLEVYSSDDPTHQHSVMTLNIIGSGSGPYSYEITQHLPLGHNSNAIEDMLKDALSNADNLPPELASLGLDNILNALGGGNMLALPLPIVITDNDGDSAVGLAVVAIRDSVPVAPAAASAYVGESDLIAATNHGDAGRDAAHTQENVAQNTNADESVYKGTMTVNYGFDGAHKDSPFEWNKPADGLYKTSDGKPIHWDYDGGNHMKLVGYDEGGDKVAVIEVTKFTNNYDVSDPAHPNYTGTVEYKVTLLESLQHPTAQGENDLKLDIGFIIRDGDGDTAGNTLSVVVKDDIPQGYDEWDKSDIWGQPGGYGATGNVITGDKNWSDSGFTKPGTPDTYGADGRAATGGFKVVDPDFSTADIHDGTAKAVEPGDTLTIAGKYGDITFNGDGSYTYVIDKARYEAGVPTKIVTQYPETTIDLAENALTNPDVSFTAFKNKGLYMDGWTPKNDPLPGSGDFGSLNAIKSYIGNHAATAVDAGSGVGVAGNASSITSDGNEIGRGATASEGLLIDLKNAGGGEVSVKFGDLSDAEGVTIYLYDAAGNLIPSGIPLSGGAFLFSGLSGDTFSYNGATPVAHIVVMPTVVSNTFTVDAITYPKAVEVAVPDPTAPYNPQETFDYILTDKDGDTTQQTLTINVTPPAPITFGDGLTVDKSFLVRDVNPGSATSAAGAAGANPVNDTGSVVASKTLSFPDNQVADLKVQGYDNPDCTGGLKTFTVTNGLTVYSEHGYLTFTTSTAGGNTSVTYKFTLTDNYNAHSDITKPDDVALGVDSFKFTYGNGFDAGTLKINIEDDAPVAANDSASFDEKTDADLMVSGNVLDNDRSGADGWNHKDNADPDSRIETVTGYTFDASNSGYAMYNADGTTPAPATLVAGTTYTIMHMVDTDRNGTPDTYKPVGTFVLNANGEYTFTKIVNDSGLNEDVTINLKYTVRDSEGDTSSATLALGIKHSAVQMYITGDSVVYEEAAYGPIHGASGWNKSGDESYTLANYKINWTDNGTSTPTDDFRANGTFTFEVKAAGANGSVQYGATGDVQFGVDANGDKAIDVGSYLIKGGESAYMDALNAVLKAEYGTHMEGNVEVPNVQIAGVTWAANGWPTLKFEVHDGTVLAGKPLPLTVESVNDRLNDSGENYTLTLQNPVVKSGAAAEDVKVISDPDLTGSNPTSVTTTIIDGMNTGYGSGPWLKITDVSVYESTTKDGTTFNHDKSQGPSDVTLRINAYNPDIASIGQATTGHNAYTGLQADGSVLPPASQNITLYFSCNGGTATADKDYYTNINSTVIKITDWKVYDDAGKLLAIANGTGTGCVLEPSVTMAQLKAALADGSAHWEARPVITGLIADDSFTEGDEKFNINITGISGNESFVHTADKTAGITIIEDKEPIPADGTAVSGDHHYLDGPSLVGFVLNGELREPIATDVPGNNPGKEGMPSTSTQYAVVLDGVASEDIIVTVKLDTVQASLGQDFTLGNGIMTYAQLVQYYEDEGTPIPPYFVKKGDASDYYVVVKGGSDKAHFSVNILHDHDTALVAGGLDGGPAGVAEKVNFTITNMVGSEVQWGDGYYKNGESTTGAQEIHDDMRGPVVFVDVNAAGMDWTNNTISGSVHLGTKVAMGEKVLITLEAVGADGHTYTCTTYVEMDKKGSVENFTLNLADFKYTDPGTGLTVTLAAQPYFQIRVSDTVGGETQHDPHYSGALVRPGGEGDYGPLVVGVKPTDIYEGGVNGGEKPASVSYEISVGNIANHEPGEDASFTIRPYNNTTEDGDFTNKPGDVNQNPVNNDVNVKFSGELLDTLKDAGATGFTVNVHPDADGNPVIDSITFTDGIVIKEVSVNGSGDVDFGNGNVISGGVTVDGHLPTAYDDKLIEGNEDFTPLIVDSSNVVPDGEAPTPAHIIDNDVPTVVVSFGHGTGSDYMEMGAGAHVTEGEMLHSSGDQYTARVSLQSSDGTPLTLDADAAPVTIVLKLTSITTSPNATTEGDVDIIFKEVTLMPGQSTADMRVTFPEDFIDDNGKQFTIEASFKNPADATKFGGLEGVGPVVTSHSGALADAAGVTIDDHINGPVVVELAANNVSFNTTYNGYVAAENKNLDFVAKLDKAVAEEVTLTMKMTFDSLDGTQSGVKAGAATQFTPADVKSLVVDGVTYTVTPDGAGWKLVNGLITLPITVEGNTWKFDAPVHEGYAAARVGINFNNDFLTEDAERFSLQVVGVKGGEVTLGDAAALTKVGVVTDVLDGPAVKLIAPTTGTEGEDVTFTLNLSKDSVSPFEVKLTLGSGWKDIVEPDADNKYWVNYGGTAKEIDPDTGVVILQVSGTETRDNIALTFHTQDNAITGGDASILKVNLTSVTGGEATIAGAGSLTGVLTSQDGDSGSFDCNLTTGYSFSTVTTYTLAGLSAADAPNTSVTVGGVFYALQNLGGGKYGVVVEHPAGTFSDKLVVTIDGAPEHVRDITVNGSVMPNTSVTILDDAADAALRDGPTFTVAAPAEADEGSLVTFTIGHAPNNADFGATQEPINLTFKLTGDFSGSVSGLSLSADAVTNGLVLSGPVSGVYTLTLPAGTVLSDWDGAIKAQLNGVDTKIGADGGLGLQLTGVTGGEAALGTTVTGSTVIHDVTEGQLMLVNNSGASVTEGGDMSFTLKLVGTDGTTALTATQAMSVTLHLSGVGTNPAVAADLNLAGWTDKGSGVYEKTLTLNAGSSSVNLTIPTVADSILEHSEGVRVEVASSNIPTSIAANITDNTGNVQHDITITDTSTGHLVLTQPASLDVVEGGSLKFSLDLQNAASHAAMTASEAMVVTFLVSGLAATDIEAATLGGTNSAIDITGGNGVTWTAHLDSGTGQPDGSYVMTATLAAGQSHLDINIPVNTAADGHVIHGLEGLEIKVLDTQTNNLDVTLTDASHASIAAGTHYDVSISDADYAALQGHLGTHTPDLADVKGMELVDMGVTADHDGSAATHGQIIFGGDVDNSIIGTGHDDIIFGGGGHDILTGGLGDDIFGWHGTDIGTALAPAVDTITDFSMTTDPNHQGAFGDDHLDLRDLISDARESTLDQYLTIEHKGADAELHISTTPGGEPTQTIVLQDVYTNHGVDLGGPTVDQDTSHVDELIKQHIILNS